MSEQNKLLPFPEFSSPRKPVYGYEGMVAGEHPTAVATAIQVLQDGGNAIDAALAMSAMLMVVQPHLCHLGGDAFIQVYWADAKSVTAINAGGKAPSEATIERYREAGGVPTHGPLASTVPGVVDAWAIAHERWGTWPLATLLEPAVQYAREGFAIGAGLATSLDRNAQVLTRFPDSRRIYLKEGRTPTAGERLVQEDVAHTLDAIGQGGRDVFYRGDIAQSLVQAVQREGGILTLDDLAQYHADVLEPVVSTYRGYTISEQPPNSQGLIVLEVLNILEGFDLASIYRERPASAVHLIAEALRLAFDDRERFIGDPQFVDAPVSKIISKDYAAQRRQQLDLDRAVANPFPARERGDTTLLVLADRWGNMVTFIQTLYHNFGCGFVAGDTGIFLNNRMIGFSLQPAHPNALLPGKRTMHTLNTYLVFKDGAPLIAGGTPGGPLQVQTNVQVLTNIIDLGMNVQEAMNMPRWGYTGETGMLMEDSFSPGMVKAMEEIGHRVTLLKPTDLWFSGLGRAQAIMRDPEKGSYAGASDSRGEGGVIGI